MRIRDIAGEMFPAHRFWCVFCAMLITLNASASEPDDKWRAVYRASHASVEAAKTASGFDRHRGEVFVCGTIQEVTDFAADVERYSDWVSHTEQARLISRTPERTVFYLRNSAPWPMKDRDMVYELVPDIIDERTVVVAMNGLPQEIPAEPGVVRMKLAQGEWRFQSLATGELSVRLSLYIEPGRAPKLFANRRFAHMIGDTLSALAERYPCSTSAEQVDSEQL
jgi:hypothetical protein